ncbi:DUF4179 domain-containing protein [Sporosarcina sp. Te-1]|uniref:DUF4179 domain-containing protein n=1 Tax=Sporosarcina sp. Te-1 TaxID=2818390 RepID=UPI001A9EF7AB|nr:DUF4179 domain-containing protein [Sporosarcina sp. Te-1]QTD39765.1 DUF4179 domain-containing protein [Sporosarcina sp. Te-1]
MNCPTGDKLSQYVDSLLPSEEHAEIKRHVETCKSCQTVVSAYQEEQAFLEETLKTPMLPEHFTDLVLDQLVPYPNPKKIRRKALWKRVALSAAGIIMAVGLGATFNPSFAQFLGGLFSTDQVDEGLQLAADAGLAKRVDLQVEDQGLTFRVEDVIADSSRITLSFQVLNSAGKPQDTYLNLGDTNNAIKAFDQNGEELFELGTGWQEGSDYGIVEFSLRGHQNLEQVTILFDLFELNGVKGNWQLEVPVDLHENRKLTKKMDLKNATGVHHGVQIDLKKLQIAPSSIELLYETAFTKEERKNSEEAKRKFEDLFGKDSMDSLVFGNNTSIAYHIENAKGDVIYSAGRSTREETGLLRGSGEDIDITGGTAWIDSFIPKGEEQLTFVLDGVYKTEPTDLSLAFKPKDIRKEPVSFSYKGSYLTIKTVKKPFFSEDRSVVIKMEGGMDSLDDDFGSWIAVDDNGKSYPANFNGSIFDEKDKNGRHKAELDLVLEGLQEVPEELTLYLVTKRSYYPVEKQWEVPLTEKE